MKPPPSPHFTPVDLKRYFNVRRRELDVEFSKKAGDNDWSDKLLGLQALRGIPFLFGDEVGPDALALSPGEASVNIELLPMMATYVIFVQATIDRPPATPHGFDHVGPTTVPVEGIELGELVSTYSLQYADGSEVDLPVLPGSEFNKDMFLGGQPVCGGSRSRAARICDAWRGLRARAKAKSKLRLCRVAHAFGTT